MRLASIIEVLKESLIGLGSLYLFIVTLGVLITPLLFIYILISLKERTKGENIFTLALLVVIFVTSMQLYDSAENAHNLSKEQLTINAPLPKETVTFSPDTPITTTPEPSTITTSPKTTTNTPLTSTTEPSTITTSPKTTRTLPPSSDNNGPLITENLISVLLFVAGGLAGLVVLGRGIKVSSSLVSDRRSKRKKKKAQKLDNIQRYKQQRALFEQLETIYAQAETNKETLLFRPIILDVTYPETAAFHRELKQAQLELEIAAKNLENKVPINTDKLEAEIAQAQRAWDVLVAKSIEIGFPKIEGRKARLLQKHLDTVLDESVTVEERNRNLEALTSILADVKKSLTDSDELRLAHVVQEVQIRVEMSEGLGMIVSSGDKPALGR